MTGAFLPHADLRGFAPVDGHFGIAAEADRVHGARRAAERALGRTGAGLIVRPDGLISRVDELAVPEAVPGGEARREVLAVGRERGDAVAAGAGRGEFEVAVLGVAVGEADVGRVLVAEV